MLHYFDYLSEQNTIRNNLFTNMIQQAGNDRTLFASTSRSQLPQIQSAEYVSAIQTLLSCSVFFNTGAPWNVPAGSSANLEHLIEHYKKETVELEQQRIERVERMARRAEAAGKPETQKIKEALGFATKTASDVGSKVAKGE